MGTNDSTGALLYNGVYRTAQFFRDGRAYGNSVVELLPEQSTGNLIGYWACNETNSSSTHVHVVRAQFYYDTNGGPNIITTTADYTCDNTHKSCVGLGIHRNFNSQVTR